MSKQNKIIYPEWMDTKISSNSSDYRGVDYVPPTTYREAFEFLGMEKSINSMFRYYQYTDDVSINDIFNMSMVVKDYDSDVHHEGVEYPEERLTAKGIDIGVIGDHRKAIYLSKFEQISQINIKMGKSMISPSKDEKFGIKIAKDGILRSSSEVLTQKGVNMSKIREIWSDIPFFSKEIDEQVEINAHYRGYLKKQKADILAFKRDENLIIPDKINYDGLSGLSNEVKAKFKEIKPKTMGQALRIDGITPAAVYILLSHVKRKSIKHIA